MKTCFFAISASITLSLASIQAQDPVYDAAVMNAVNSATNAITTGNSDVLAKLTEILNEAKTQNETLQKQLDRAGDPTNLYQNALTLLKNDVAANAALLKTNAEREAMLSAANGSTVFGRSTYGITSPVDETVMLKDGTDATRDPAKYEIEGKMFADVDEYRRIREEALQRKKTLSAELQQTMSDLEAAQSFAAIQKYGSLILVLQGQIASTDSAAEQALHDMEVLDREIKIQSSASRKANAEKAQLERDHNAEGRSTSTLADRQEEINTNKASALQKAADYMTKHEGTGYVGGNKAKGPNLQWKKKGSDATDPPPEGTEE